MSHPHDPHAATLAQAEQAMRCALACLREYQFLSRCEAVTHLEDALASIKQLATVPPSQGGGA